MENTYEQPTKRDRQEQERKTRVKAAKNEERKAITKRVALWGGVVAALGAMVWGLAWLGSSSQNSTGGPLADPVTEYDWVRGAKDATVTLVEYSDLQCPACAAVEPTLRRIAQDFAGKVRMVYRHFPLMQHPYSNQAARAAEAAGKQGKFWEMHDLLFDEQPKWSSTQNIDATLAGYAARLGLDPNKFKVDYASPSVEQAVSDDNAGAVRSDVNSTPTFFLNGVKLIPQNFEDIYNAVAKEIKKTNK